MNQASHFSVLLQESVAALITDSSGIYIDGTFGRGGHSRAILAGLSDAGRLLAFDKDPQAVEVGRALAQQDARFEMIHDSFAALGAVAERHGVAGRVAGILLDLGVSSPQLEIGRAHV